MPQQPVFRRVPGRMSGIREKKRTEGTSSMFVVNIILSIIIIAIIGFLVYHYYNNVTQSSQKTVPQESIVQHIPDNNQVVVGNDVAMASCAMNDNCTRAVCTYKHPELSTTCSLNDCRSTFFNNPGSCFDNGVVNGNDCKKRFGNDLFTAEDCKAAYFKDPNSVFNASLVSAKDCKKRFGNDLCTFGDCRTAYFKTADSCFDSGIVSVGDCKKRFGNDLCTLDDCKAAYFKDPGLVFDSGVVTVDDCINKVGLKGFLDRFGDGFVFDVVLSDQKFTIRSNFIVLAHIITFMSTASPKKKGATEGCYVRDGTTMDEDVTEKMRILQRQQQYSQTLTDSFVQNIRKEPNAPRTTFMTKVLIIIYHDDGKK